MQLSPKIKEGLEEIIKFACISLRTNDQQISSKKSSLDAEKFILFCSLLAHIVYSDRFIRELTFSLLPARTKNTPEKLKLFRIHKKVRMFIFCKYFGYIQRFSASFTI